MAVRVAVQLRQKLVYLIRSELLPPAGRAAAVPPATAPAMLVRAGAVRRGQQVTGGVDVRDAAEAEEEAISGGGRRVGRWPGEDGSVTAGGTAAAAAAACTGDGLAPDPSAAALLAGGIDIARRTAGSLGEQGLVGGGEGEEVANPVVPRPGRAAGASAPVPTATTTRATTYGPFRRAGPASPCTERRTTPAAASTHSGGAWAPMGARRAGGRGRRPSADRRT